MLEIHFMFRWPQSSTEHTIIIIKRIQQKFYPQTLLVVVANSSYSVLVDDRSLLQSEVISSFKDFFFVFVFYFSLKIFFKVLKVECFF